MNNYENVLFKHPDFEVYFRDFVDAHDGKEESKRSSSVRIEDIAQVQSHLRDRVLRDEEELINFHRSNSSNSLSDEEDERHNQEAFMRMKEGRVSPQSERMRNLLRKGSNGHSSEEEEEAAEDMGLYGNSLT